MSLESYDRNFSQDRGLAAMIAVHGDSVLQGLTAPGDREIAQRILLDLVHLGEGRPHTRRRRTLGELRRHDDANAPGRFERVLQTLVGGRLVTAGYDPPAVASAVGHVDLAHDVLITGWPALASWVKDRGGDMVKQRRFEDRAGEWVTAGRTRGLLDGGDLAEARAWCDSPGGRALQASPWLVELIEASETNHIRAQREKEDMIARLVDERHKTHESIAAAVEIANEIVFDIDNSLEAVAGASRVRELLLARTRMLLERLKALGELDSDARRIEMVAKLAQADFARQRGRLDEAHRLLQEVLEHARRQVDTDPANAGCQHDLLVSYMHLGNVAIDAGKLDDARASFEQSHALLIALTVADPNNPQWQRDLSVSYEKLGNVAVAAGQLANARTWFEQ